MICLINDSPQNFLKDIENKKLFFWGAGKRAKYICGTYQLKNKIEAIIDNNNEKCGDVYVYEDISIPIVNIEYFINYIIGNEKENIVLLITPVFYALSIIEQLNSIPGCDNIRCYLGTLLDDYYEKKYFEFFSGEKIIPKKIHYCWFGGKEIPEHLQYYMSSWKKKCPDYEIIRWDESNYDVSKNRYMREAYECKKWGFVPDYARLDIIYNEGGIYLDTDVELTSSLDNLLCDNMYAGFNCYGLISLGLGFGAVAKNGMIRELRDAYDDKTFYNNDGSENLTTCSWYQHPVFSRHGFKITNEYQNHNGIVLYPSEVLAPTGASGCAGNFTEKTISIHHANLGWITDDEKKEYERTRDYLGKMLG